VAVQSEAFRNGDVYIDFPQEDVMFRYDKPSGKVYRRFYGEEEVEIEHSSDLFAQAQIYGTATTREEYLAKMRAP
jgi:hypothetical protein